MRPVWYDDAVPRFARLIADHVGKQALLENVILRDASGVLTFVVLDQEIPQGVLGSIAEAAKALAPYVDRIPVATPEQLFDEGLRHPGIGLIEWAEDRDFAGFVRILERRIVGSDWLREPARPIADVPPVIVFASHKGGVGRSTALCVAAAQMAEEGRNILVLDLDLEAPGLGSMLLPDDRLPRFGALDFYVENGLREINDLFLEEMTASSPLTTGRGLIHVIPAIGRTSDERPQNVIGKLSRAYLEDPCPDQPPRSFLDQTRELIQAVSRRARYDAIFVDARAGLNESTAAAVLGLGAHTLLFGIHTPQTFRGYRYLLGFLGRYRGLVGTVDVGEWRHRLRFVHAKAPANPLAWERFQDDAYDLLSETLYDLVDESASGQAPLFNFERHSDDGPHKAWHVLNDMNYFEFDPLVRPEQLKQEVFERTFIDLIQGIEQLIKQGAVQ